MATKKGEITIPPKKIALYDELIRTIPEIERKGVTMPYTSFNGHMFTFLSKDGTLGIRLSKEEREDFLTTFQSTLFEQYGAVMNEYVTIPASLLENTNVLKKYLQMSYSYVKTLNPKPTKKKK